MLPATSSTTATTEPVVDAVEAGPVVLPQTVAAPAPAVAMSMDRTRAVDVAALALAALLGGGLGVCLCRMRTARNKHVKDNDMPPGRSWRSPKQVSFDDTFFGAELADMPTIWPVSAVHADIYADHFPRARAAVDRYGQLTSMQPPTVHLSTQDNAPLIRTDSAGMLSTGALSEDATPVAVTVETASPPWPVLPTISIVETGVPATGETHAADADETVIHTPLTHEARVAEAKKLLTTGSAQKAIGVLADTLANPQASGEAWTVAGWCWWRMARDGEPNVVENAVRAIRAFHHAMAAEPDRAAMLGGALIRCHLFAAGHQQGPARAESLAAALRQMEGRATKHDDTASVVEHAHALYEHALLASAEERKRELEWAEQKLTGLGDQALDNDARWLLGSVRLALAEGITGRVAATWLDGATEVLKRGLQEATPETRDNWLARLIDVERSRLPGMTAAARLMHLRQLRDAYEPALAQARSVPPLLSWIQVLREWATMLSHAPARQKLAEVEPLFEHIEALSPDDVDNVQFARAYYLRLRAAQEPNAVALDTLAAADAMCARIGSPSVPTQTLALERAEVALARSGLLSGREQRDALDQAIRLSDSALSTPDANRSLALICGINARLAKAAHATLANDDIPPLASLAQQLLEREPDDADALHLVAKCEFAGGDTVAAAWYCEAAWEAGCRHADLLRLWREALSRKPGAAGRAGEDPQWKRLNQCVRIAQSTGQATR